MAASLIYSGNAGEDGAPFRQWFVGDLAAWAAPFPGGLRDTRQLSIKWGTHLRGERRPGGWSAGDDQVTVSVLVSGRFILSFVDQGDLPLQGPGDYAIWAAGIAHDWRAEEDSVVLTVRWREGP